MLGFLMVAYFVLGGVIFQGCYSSLTKAIAVGEDRDRAKFARVGFWPGRYAGVFSVVGKVSYVERGAETISNLTLSPALPEASHHPYPQYRYGRTMFFRSRSQQESAPVALCFIYYGDSYRCL